MDREQCTAIPLSPPLVLQMESAIQRSATLPFMKRRNIGFTRKHVKLGVGVATAVVLVGGSFAVASGASLGNPASYLAAVVTTISGKPVITITKNPQSPSGSITTGGERVVAMYDISVKRVSHFANVNSITIDVPVTGAAAAHLNLKNFSATYRYCIPSGVTYGYGYKGGLCGNIPMEISSPIREGNTYKLVVRAATPIPTPIPTATPTPISYSYLKFPLYPEQSSGVLTIKAVPQYASGLSSSVASIRTAVKSISASADQCKIDTATNTKVNCVSMVPGVILGKSTVVLTIQRSYGYGYCLL